MTASPASEPARHPSFNRFVDTIAALRAPDGCPWDRVQTHESIAHNMIEEAYEAVDAIERGDATHLREELGDVLLQVVLQSQIAADDGEFTIDDVCADANAKMVRRHPHVFGEVQAANASEVLDLWDQVKLAEKNSAVAVAAEVGNAGAQPEGLLDGVPTSFPALMQAQKISRKAAAVGFEWEALDDVWAKVREEVDELREAYAAAPKAANGKVDADAVSPGSPASSDSAVAAAAVAAVEEEFGDVLFSLVNVGRRMGVDAEGALRTTCRKFRDRWSFMEHAAQRQHLRIEDLDLAALEALWTESKRR